MTFRKELLVPAPVLTPTSVEFANPIEYLSRPDIVELGSKYGIVKVLPPRRWRPPFSISDSFKFSTRLQKLSDLGLQTRSRMFFVENLNRFLKMKRRPKAQSPFLIRERTVYHYDLHLKVVSLGGVENMTDNKWEMVNRQFGVASTSRSIKHEYMSKVSDYARYLAMKSGITTFPDTDSEDEQESCLVCGLNDDPTETLLCDNCDNPFHMKCLDPPMSHVPFANWYCDKCLIGTGEYGFEEDDEKYTIQEFHDSCRAFSDNYFYEHFSGHSPSVDELETKFWDLIETENDLEVKYGADIHNFKPGEISGFPMFSTPNIDHEELKEYINHPFNLTRLPFAKGSLLNYIDSSISGMTVPWIYVGSLFSTFCWHVEDHYTLSANYCHFGETKKWYGIPSSEADKFERLMRQCAPDLFRKQPDLLHQLVTLLSPSFIAENGIKCVYADQNPNEFIITYPKVYHAGFNCGFNFNEAVNFTMNDWVSFGKNAIDEYKLIKKENVFNHFELVENILKEFNVRYNFGSLGGSTRSGYLNLIEKCLASFKGYAIDEYINFRDPFFRQIQSEFKTKNVKKRKLDEEKEGVFTHIEEDEDELLCDVCKTAISYQYITIGTNKKHLRHSAIGTSTPPQNEKPLTSNLLQLMTPENSPNSSSKADSDGREPITTPPQSAMKISSILNDPVEVKRELTPEPEIEERSLRHSSRIKEKDGAQDPIYTSKMRSMKMSSSAKQKQSNRTLLCLKDCLKLYKGKRIPAGMKLVYESSPFDLVRFVDTTERNLASLKPQVYGIRDAGC